ncbi:hypothetical protein Bca101_007851 [Brassica carinata]
MAGLVKQLHTIKKKKKHILLNHSHEWCCDFRNQLEEFERAVRLSHGRCRDDTTLTRHKQFVSAIENQIHRVQSALSENGEQPLRWVDLNKEERDDLAMFLSGSSQTSESFSSESINLSRCYGDCVIDIDDERGSPESAGNRNGTRRTWSSPNVPDISALRINVPLEEEENKRYVSQTEATPKEKGYKPLFWMQSRPGSYVQWTLCLI